MNDILKYVQRTTFVDLNPKSSEVCSSIMTLSKGKGWYGGMRSIGVWIMRVIRLFNRAQGIYLPMLCCVDLLENHPRSDWECMHMAYGRPVPVVLFS